MDTEWQKRKLIATLTGPLLAVAAGCLTLSKAGGWLVSLSYDLPFMLHRAGGSDQICIVYLDKFDAGLLDRGIQAKLLDKISATGARMVIYDVVFDQPWKEAAVDEELAKAMLRFRGVQDSGAPLPGATRRCLYLAAGRETYVKSGAAVEKLIVPTDRLLDAADDFGLVAQVLGEGFTPRQLSTGTLDDASLTWKAAVAMGAPLDEAQRLFPRWINYAGPPPDADGADASPTFRTVSASDVMEGAEPGFFRNRIVIIGGRPGIAGNALGKDLFATPFHRFSGPESLPYMSGVEVNANALSNLLRGNWLTRTGLAFDLTFLGAAGILAGLAFRWLLPLRGLLVALGAMLLLGAAGVAFVHWGRVWFPWSVAAFVQIPLALAWASGQHFYSERVERIRLARDEQALREALARRPAEMAAAMPPANVAVDAPVNVFVSYARKDLQKMKQLLPHLDRLERQGHIKLWTDHLIPAGHEWEAAILKALDSADLILLLVSANFLVSNFIRGTELPIARDRQRAGTSRVIWVRLTETRLSKTDELEAWISSLQCATRGSKPISKFSPREDGWNEVQRSLEQAAIEYQSRRNSG